MGFTWRSHYVLYFIPPLFCTIVPCSQLHTHIYRNGLPPSPTHSPPHSTCLHTHPHPTHTPDCRVRSRYTLWIRLSSEPDVLGECSSWVLLVLNLLCGGLLTEVVGGGASGGRDGLWCHCHYSDWLRSDLTHATVTQLTCNSTGQYRRERVKSA